MGSAGSPMSNHEIEMAAAARGGGGLHDQGTLLHSVCMRHESAAHRDSSDQDRGAPSGRGQVLAVLDRGARWPFRQIRLLCKWEEMPVHILSLEQQTTPEARLFPPNAPFDRAGFTSTRTRCSTTSRAVGCLGRARRSSTRATGRRVAGRGASARGRSTGATPPVTCATALRRTRSTQTRRLRAPAAAVGSASRS